jgi:hypothetical protein
MTPRTLLGLGSLLGTALLSIACAVPPTDDGSGALTSDLTGHTTETPITLTAPAPVEWARCWVEATGGAAGAQDVLCSSSILPNAALVIDRIAVSFASGSTSLGSKVLASGGRVAAAPQGRGVLPSQFPLTITLEAAPSYGKTNMGVSIDTDVLTTTLTIASPAAATKDHPATIVQPFSTWPIAIVERPRNADDLFAYVPAVYDVPCAPFVTASDHPKQLRVAADTDTVPLANRQHVIRTSLVAPVSGSGGIKVGVTLNMTTDGRAALKQTAVIDGPGIYIAEPTGLRKATAADTLPAELLESRASAPAAPPPDAVTNVCDPSRRPATDPDSSACGASGQRCCNPIPGCDNSGTCADDGECIGTTCL